MNNKKYKIISGGVLVIALVAMIGIVYAAYSQTLNINGDATVKANSWNVRFANLSEAKLTGEAKEITKPSINNNSTTIGDYSVLLSKPGDSITYTFDIVNEGTFDAVGFVIPLDLRSDGKFYSEPACMGTGENAEEDAANVCKYLTYTLTIPESAMENESTINLPNKTTITGCTLTLTYSSDVPYTELPKNDVIIAAMARQIVFEQDK